jgi:hypothetical protein
MVPFTVLWSSNHWSRISFWGAFAVALAAMPILRIALGKNDGPGSDQSRATPRSASK